MRRLPLLLLIFVVLAAHATIYQWRDEQGGLHFSDRPSPGADKVKLPAVQTYSPVEILPAPQPMTIAPRQYKTVSIRYPEQEETIRNNFGLIDIAVDLEPNLVPGDKLRLLIDGEPVGEAHQSTSFSVEGIFRGTHHLSVEVINSKEKVVGRSEPITIFMHRYRVNMVPKVVPAKKPVPPKRPIKPTPVKPIAKAKT